MPSSNALNELGEIDMVEDATTLARLLEKNLRENPDNLAVIDSNRRLTYRELNDEVEKTATTLINMGVKKGDKLGIWMPNNVEWTVAWFSITAIGGVVIPMDTWYKPAEAEYILGHSDSVGVFINDRSGRADYIAMMNEIWPKLPALKSVIVNGEPAEGMLSFDEIIRNTEIDRKAVDERRKENDIDDVAFILYTSGTTGKPKGAMLSYHNITKNAKAMADILFAKKEDKLLVPVPFSHCFGNVLSITMASVAGMSMYAMSAFDPEEALRVIETEKCTMINGVPTMFVRMLEVLDRKHYDTTSLRTGAMAGAPCPIDIMKGTIERMHCNVSIAYGLTEASPLITMTRFDDPIEKRVETVGRPIPDVEVRIVDDDRNPLPVGEMGELACRGYNVMKGYYKMPEATAETIDEEGWLYSGDLAVRDDEGYISIVGRKKDMVIVGGFNVYPRELEEFYIAHPKILDVAVVGVPDHDLGEIVAAAVIPAPGLEITPQEVVDYSYGKVASAKVPRFVMITDSLPISGRGKVQKFILRKQFQEKIEEGELKKMVPSAVRQKQKVKEAETLSDRMVSSGKVNTDKKEKLEKFIAGLDDEQEAALEDIMETKRD